MNRKQVLNELNNIMEIYCQDCFLKSTFRKEKGKKFAQSFCIHQCTVGQKIQEIGERFNNNKM